MRDGSSAPKAQGEATLLKQVLFIKAITADPEVTVYGKAVANALVFEFFNRDEGFARPGHAKIAEAAGISVTMVKRGIKSLQARGWFCVQPAFDEAGDPAPNRYFPIWKRATGSAPAGSERARKARRKSRVLVATASTPPSPVERADLPVSDAQTKQRTPIDAPQIKPVKSAPRPLMPRHSAGRRLPMFEGKYVKFSAITVNRWAAEFSSIPDLFAAMREIEPSITTIPEGKRQDVMKGRLRDRNEAEGKQIRIGAPSLANLGSGAEEEWPF